MISLDERSILQIDQEGRLIEQLRLRNMGVFELFYKAYRPKLRGFILNIIASEQVVDEVFDDVMMVVWNKINDFQGRSKLSTWIYGIAYRRALKERNKRTDVEYTDQIEEPEVEESEASRPFEAIHAKSRLDAALGKLSTDQGTVIRLAYFEGLNYKEIGAIMECPEDTVKTRMFHGRKKLKRALGGSLADWV